MHIFRKLFSVFCNNEKHYCSNEVNTNKLAEVICFCFTLIWIIEVILSSAFYKCFSWQDIFFGFLLYCQIQWLRKNGCCTKFRKILYFMIITACCVTFIISSAILLYYFFSNRVYNTYDLSFVATGTKKEMFDFLFEEPFQKAICFSAILFAILLATVKFLTPHKTTHKTNFTIRFIYICGLILAYGATAKLVGVCYPRQVVKEYYGTKSRHYNSVQNLNECESYALKVKAMQPCSRDKNTSPTLVILVLGESASRDIMSCYDFNINTTPFFNQLKKNHSQQTFFLNGYTYDISTIVVTHNVLTNSHYVNPKTSNQTLSLFSILKWFDIESTVFSNQGYWFWQYSTATTHSFVNNKQSENMHLLDIIDYDDKLLLPMLEEKLQNSDEQKSSIVFLHLKGSHFPFKQRLPIGYQTRLNRNDFKTDNSFVFAKTIENTDSFFKELFSLVQKRAKTPYVICYVSDHGESIQNFSRRCYPLENNPPEVFRIPAMFYFSENYIKLNKSKVDNLKNNSNLHFSNDCIFDAVLELFDIKVNSTDISIPEYNVFSKSYNPEKTTLKIDNI